MDGKTFRKVMRSLGGLKLAVMLISLVAAVMIVATVYERSLDAEVATSAVYRVFYGSFWFGCLLVLLAINVTSAAINRFPWKWRQSGFLMTHLAVVVIVAGSMVTRWGGREGTIRLKEGQSASEMVMREPVLSATVTETGSGDQVAVDRARGPDRKHLAVRARGEPVEIAVKNYFANSRLTHSVESGGPSWRPGVRLRVQDAPAPGHAHPPLDKSLWLVAGDPGHDRARLGTHTIRLAAARDIGDIVRLLDAGAPRPRTQPSKQPPLGVLTIDLGERGRFDIPVKANLGKRIPLGKTAIHARIKSYLPSAVYRQGRLVNRTTDPTNPAVIVELLSPMGTETNFAFAMFPNFGSMHKKKGALASVKLLYKFTPPPVRRDGEMVLVVDATSRIHYSAPSPSGQVVRGTVELNQSIPVPWGGPSLQVEQLIVDARWTRRPKQVPQDPSSGRNTPAVQLAVVPGRQADHVWLRFGEEKEIRTPRGPVRVYFGPRLFPLGFTLTLDDFRVKTYGGSSMASGYESDVKVGDSQSGVALQRTISMNAPLTYAGYTFYQASYAGEDTTILSASYDPGTPVVYVGFVVLIVGIFVTTVLHWVRDYRRKRFRPATGPVGSQSGTRSPAGHVSPSSKDLSECSRSLS